MDRRIRKTKNSIRKVLMQLLEEDLASKITVTEICQITDINRSTFYSHYDDIEGVLSEIEDELMEEIIQKVRSHGQGRFNILLKEISDCISLSRETYQILAKSDEAHFIGKLKTTVSKLLSLEEKGKLWEPELKHSHEYIRAFLVSGITGLLLEWLKLDCVDTIPAVSKELQNYFDMTSRN